MPQLQSYRKPAEAYHRATCSELQEQPRAKELDGREMGPSRRGNDTAGECPSSSPTGSLPKPTTGRAAANYQSSPGQRSSMGERWVPHAAGTIPLVNAPAPVLPEACRSLPQGELQRITRAAPGKGARWERDGSLTPRERYRW